MLQVSDLTYTWTIQNFVAYPTFNDLQNVVFSVDWKLSATYVDETKTPSVEYVEECVESTPISTDNIADFVPFEQLTLDITVGWISQVVDVDAIKIRLLSSIEHRMNPPPPSVVILPPPF